MELDRRGYLVELQSIRGIAAVIVVLGHAWGLYGGPAWWVAVDRIFNGRAAVATFFVLSGYVLTRMLQNKPMTIAAQADFMTRRVFRIYPALLVATAAALGFVLLYRHVHLAAGGNWLDDHFTPERLNSREIVLSFLGLGAHLMPQAWTIAIELAGSLLMPGIAWLAIKHSSTLLAVFMVTLTLGLTVGKYTPYGVLMYIPHFMAGALLYVMPERAMALLRRLPGRPMVVVAALVLVGLRSFFAVPYNDPVLAAVELICAVVVIGMISGGGVSWSWLRSPAAEWLGDISYSLYLIHFVVLCFVIVGIDTVEQAVGMQPGPVANSALLTCVALAVALPLSTLLLRRIEEPGNELGKQLVRAATRAWAAP